MEVFLAFWNVIAVLAPAEGRAFHNFGLRPYGCLSQSELIAPEASLIYRFILRL